MSRNKTTDNGLNLGSLICVALTVLKILGYINLSWFWVLFPITIPLVIAAVLFIWGYIAITFFD